MRRSSPALRFTLVVLALILASGCTSGRPEVTGTGTPIRVTERDFHISAPSRIPPGDVALSAYNEGPDHHELIVVRADAELPLRPDGLTVDEEAVESATLGAIEPYEPGSVETLRMHLSPGRYEFFCNMSGHYLGGMRRIVVVQ